MKAGRVKFSLETLRGSPRPGKNLRRGPNLPWAEAPPARQEALPQSEYPFGPNSFDEAIDGAAVDDCMSVCRAPARHDTRLDDVGWRGSQTVPLYRPYNHPVRTTDHSRDLQAARKKTHLDKTRVSIRSRS